MNCKRCHIPMKEGLTLQTYFDCGMLDDLVSAEDREAWEKEGKIPMGQTVTLKNTGQIIRCRKRPCCGWSVS